MATIEFTGNHDDYYDPRNSYLHEVLERRVGIPITLSVLAIEIGRRVGVPVVGVGMPAHFLVRDGADAARDGDASRFHPRDDRDVEAAVAAVVVDEQRVARRHFDP